MLTAGDLLRFLQIWPHTCFRKTLKLGLPFIESHLDKLSSWNQGLMLKFLEKVTLIHRETFILFFPQGILFKVTLPNQLNQDGEQGKQVPQRPVQARFQL